MEGIWRDFQFYFPLSALLVCSPVSTWPLPKTHFSNSWASGGYREQWSEKWARSFLAKTFGPAPLYKQFLSFLPAVGAAGFRCLSTINTEHVRPDCSLPLSLHSLPYRGITHTHTLLLEANVSMVFISMHFTQEAHTSPDWPTVTVAVPCTQ